MKWTKAQLAAIETTGTSLLVSAAAGSGKTAVLAERCAQLVCHPSDPCSVDELLVVTFTKASAEEMRLRIESALRERLTDDDDPRLTRQLWLIGQAQISTIHGFCTSVLRRHFHLLDLDPNFRVLDEQEADLLRHEIARDVLDDRYEQDDGGPFRRFVDQYGNGADRIILQHVLRLHELTGSLVDPKGWLAESAARVKEAATVKPLAKTCLGKELAQLIRAGLADLRSRWLDLATRISQIDGLEPYGEYVNELLATTQHWQDLFADSDFDRLAKEVAEFEFPRLPSIKKPPPEKETIKDQIDSARDEMREGTVAILSRFSEQQWRDGLSATLAPTQVLIDLVHDFDRAYANAKRELRGLDFADLERFTLQILRETPSGSDLAPSPVALWYQNHFKHVLVDEYQDINEVQDAILNLVSRQGDEKKDETSSHASSSLIPNLFCVGDVKQSIYRFRLAQPTRFLERYEKFSKSSSSSPLGKVIHLGGNFRSRAPLLDAINSLFRRLMTRDAVQIEYDHSQELVAQASYPDSTSVSAFTGAPIELHLLPVPSRDFSDDSSDPSVADLDRTEREAVFVAQRIQSLLKAGTQVAEKTADGSLALRPLRYRDIVILLRSMKYRSEAYAQALRSVGIPVHSDSSSGFFDSTEIRDMLSLLRLLDNQQQDVPMAALLRSPLCNLDHPDDALATIRLAYPKEIPFHQAAVRYAKEHSDPLANRLVDFLDQLSRWRTMAQQRPIAELIWHVYDATGYLAFCAGMQDGQQRVANLIEFHERATQFGTFQRQGLGRFMEFLENLADHADLGQPSIASAADDVVRIMSIHRAKGLEFPVVIVPEMGKLHNLQDSRSQILADRDAGIGLSVIDEARQIRYPSLAHLLVKDRIIKQSLAEEMRVLYVALTRAREHLILVGTCGEAAPSGWIDQWSAHQGPLPAGRVLAARSMLDWLGPAAAAMLGAKEQHRIEIAWHSEEELAALATQNKKHDKPTDSIDRFVKLEPLNPAPPVHPDAKRLLEKLTAVYPWQDLTEIPAAKSVGALTKRTHPFAAEEAPAPVIAPMQNDLKLPRCAINQFAPSPTESGTATHLVLEHLDFSRRCDQDDVKLQIADLVRRKLIEPELVKVVDVDSILWLLSTPLGQLLRKNNATLMRELPIYLPLPVPTEGAAPDPMDRIMIRGRVDVLIPDADGLIIADYKTDNVRGQALEDRAEFYRGQLALYRSAIAIITGKPVAGTMLVFLKAKEIRDVGP